MRAEHMEAEAEVWVVSAWGIEASWSEIYTYLLLGILIRLFLLVLLLVLRSWNIVFYICISFPLDLVFVSNFLALYLSGIKKL